MAPKTRQTYSTPIKSYTEYCALNGINPPFPATFHSLSDWVASLSVKRVKTKSIKAYLTGIRSAHVDMGFEDLDVFHSPRLKRIIDGSRRLRGEIDTQERCPITKDVLLKILPHFDRSTKHGATIQAAFCLAFAAFLRVGEFTYEPKDLREEDFDQWFLTRRQVRLYEDHLELTLPSSKTDPFRRGVTLTIAATNDEACAVRALRHLFQRYPTSLSSPLFEINGVFSRRLITDNLRQALRSVGLQGHYSGHSFRRGAATSARIAGLSEDEIKLLGRWKSDSYRLYIKTHPAYILAASRRHQHVVNPFYENEAIG